MKETFRALLVFFILSFCCSSFVLAQLENRQEVMRLQKEVVLPTTPEAASLGEYGDVQVNAYTGSANFSFPGPSLRGNHISMPVTLNYATGGIKVEDRGTWVGLGFALQAGGSITRAMRHVPDEQGNYYSKADSIAKYAAGPVIGQNLFQFYRHYHDVARDATETTQDIFYYSFNGRSGKFYISPDKEVFQSVDSDVRIVPVFDGSDALISFRITDEYGHQYVFGETETSHMEITNDILSPTNASLEHYTYDFTSTWHLTQIIGYGGYEQIDLSYTNVGTYAPPFNVAQYQSRLFTDIDQCCNGTANGNLNTGGPDEVAITNRKYLSTASLSINGIVYQALQFMVSPNTCSYTQASDRKLDRIRVLRKRDVGGTLNHILDYRFNYDCSTGRLTLKEYGPQDAGTNNFNLQPPYAFTYAGGVLPDPLSNRIDHWGYHNGYANVTGLIPSYSSTDHNYVGANRDPNPVRVEDGSLNQITYPTKGYTVLDYEPNTRTLLGGSVQYLCSGGSCRNRSNCLDGVMCCDGGAALISQEYEYIPDANIASSGYLFITADSLCGGGASESSWTGQVRISIDGVIRFDTTFSATEVSTKFAVFPFLTAGESHTLLIEGDNVDVDTQIKYESTMGATTTETTAGIRIASISNYDIDGTLLRKKTYDYNEPGTTNSSGKLMNEPNYISIGGYEHHLVTTFDPCVGDCCAYSCDRVTVSATSNTALGTTQGSFVGYDVVTETIKKGGSTAGSTRYTYYNVAHSNNATMLDHYQNGSMLKEELFNDAGQLVKSKEYEYSFDIGDDRRVESYFHSGIMPSNLQDNQSFLARNRDGSFFWTEEADEANDAEAFIPAETKYIHDFEIISNYTKYVSALKTTHYFYDESNRSVAHTQRFVYGDTGHFQMTTQIDTNSNLQVHAMSYKYGPDYAEVSDIGSLAENQNRLLPAWSIAHEVDDVRVDESLWTLRQIGSGSGAIIADPDATLDANKSLHPYQTLRYEYTWDDNGIGSGDTVVQWTDTLYSPASGMLTERRDPGWDLPVSYAWTPSGKLSYREQGNHQRNFGYDQTTDLLSSVTQIDGTTTVITYDDLLRPNTVTNCQGAEATHIYHHSMSATDENYISVSTLYPDFGSEMNKTLVNKSFFDGIGRSIQSLRLNQAPDSDEHLSSWTTYDDAGRPVRQYEPRSVSSSNYAAASGDVDTYTLLTVEDSPLNRQEEIQPPRVINTDILGRMRTAYSANLGSDVSGYGAGTLYKTIQTDAEGQQKVSFTDKRGNLILQTTQQGGEQANTLYEYDAKDRLTLVIPPDATQGNTNLVFRNVYYGDDLIQSKKVPDRAWQHYGYNSRDLLGYYEDGYLNTNNLNYAYQYDNYGRITEEGFVAPTSQSNNSFAQVTIDEIISHYEYGTSGVEIDKVVMTSHAVHNEYVPIVRNFEYDNCGRVVRQYGSSILALNDPNAYEQITTYDDADHILTTTETVRHGPDDITSVMTYGYDHAGRQDQSQVRINSLPAQTLSELSFTPKEQINMLTLGGGLQTIDYTYLPNRYLSAINNPNSMGGDLWAMHIGYDKALTLSPGTNPTLLNDGNISAIRWRVNGGQDLAYQYQYDYLKRLIAADYFDALAANNDDYSTTYSYIDDRGNFDVVTRRSAGTLIDNLQYDYYNATNQLQSVDDLTNHNAGFKEVTTNDYIQDADGCITYDAESDFDLVRDHNDMILSMATRDGNIVITNYYDAQGQLHQRLIDSFGIVRRTSYVGAFEFRNQGPSLLHHDHGFLTFDFGIEDEKILTGTSTNSMTEQALSLYNLRSLLSSADETDRAGYGIAMAAPFEVAAGAEYQAIIDSPTLQNVVYHYTIKDHLGTPRIIFSDQNNNNQVLNNEIEEVKNFYPFGLEFQQPVGDKKYRKAYNDKEAISYTQYLNFEARDYFKSINVFGGPDPISEDFPYVTPMNYAENRVPNGIDLHGLQFLRSTDAKIVIGAGGQASLKRSNLSGATATRINTAQVVSGVSGDGTPYLSTTFPITIGSLNFEYTSLEKRRPSSHGIVTEVARSRPGGGGGHQRKKWRDAVARQGLEPGQTTVTPVPGGSRGRGMGVLWALSEAANWLSNSMVQRDLNTAGEQYSLYGPDVQNIVNEAIASGLIPEDFQNPKMLGDIANYLFQGEFIQTYDASTFNSLRDLSQFLLINAGVQLNCEECQQTQD